MTVPALTTEQMIEVDRLMIEEYGITLIQMMENAGTQLATLARRMLNGAIDRRLVVLCGAGNNGGGGMVAARHLSNWGAQVEVKLAGEESRLKDAPAHQYRSLKKLGVIAAEVELDRAALIIDALIGYGLQGNPRGAIADWIDRANRSGRSILALDAPSGLDTTLGTPGRPCIKAAATLTLALPKIGLLTPAAHPVVGDLFVADIGVPPELYQHLGLEIGSIFAEDSILRIG